MEMPQVIRPIPRRAFDIGPVSAESSVPASPAPESANPDLLGNKRNEHLSSPSRTRSILNLTSSTLYGIYSNTTGNDGPRDQTSTPWGTGAQTPSHRSSVDDRRFQEGDLKWDPKTQMPHTTSRRSRASTGAVMLQNIVLFASGILYGNIVTQLHRTQQITPVPVPDLDRSTVYYHLAWGVFGILLGNALPRADLAWDQWRAQGGKLTTLQRRTSSVPEDDDQQRSSSDSGLGLSWYSAVRSSGAFIGIAFALRRLPWQSTLQVSLTLALVNPALWYLVDRSFPGFALSSGISVLGTSLLLLVNPDFVPVPAIYQHVASEKFGVYTWLASILFCTSLCFGAIGRKVQA